MWITGKCHRESWVRETFREGPVVNEKRTFSIPKITLVSCRLTGPGKPSTSSPIRSTSEGRRVLAIPLDGQQGPIEKIPEEFLSPRCRCFGSVYLIFTLG